MHPLQIQWIAQFLRWSHKSSNILHGFEVRVWLCVCVYVCVCVWLCVILCVCDCERGIEWRRWDVQKSESGFEERGRERERERERLRERERENISVWPMEVRNQRSKKILHNFTPALLWRHWKEVRKGEVQPLFVDWLCQLFNS